MFYAPADFDPIHSGHIKYLEQAKQLGDVLVVGLNTDLWLERKKGKPFMPYRERKEIVKAIHCVDHVIDFNDDDNTAIDAIYTTAEFLSKRDNIVFANGGDRDSGNVPEQDHNYFDNEKFMYCGLTFEYGVGGEDKQQSSSWLLEDWAAPKTERDWGHYRVLYEGDGFRVKELVIAPGKSLSMQRHKHRSETWTLVSGEATITTDYKAQRLTVLLEQNKPFTVPAGTWHKGSNKFEEPAHIIEVWTGSELSETDIERED